MQQPNLNVVTGAFSYTGRYIARELLERGQRVRTLTAHPPRENPFGTGIEVRPLRFNDPDLLAESLQGVTTLYNTYWVRFAHGSVTFERAVENTRVLLGAARRAGVGRIVHVSITNPSEASPLPYFRGKAQVEAAIRESGLSYAILRPTVLFGREDILVNNVAWLLRHFPAFAVPGSGDYPLQPVFVGDFAKIAVQMGERSENITRDTVGPETYTFRGMVKLIADAVRSKAVILPVHPRLTLTFARILGLGLRDVLLTRDETAGLMAGLLTSSEQPLGETRFSKWIMQNADVIGTRYASELKRHYR